MRFGGECICEVVWVYCKAGTNQEDVSRRVGCGSCICVYVGTGIEVRVCMEGYLRGGT